MTPFSGISLIIHLVIIGVGKTVNLFRGNRAYRPSRPGGIFRHGMQRLASCAIVVVILTIMISSLTTAIRTGVREGMREPQVQYIHNVIVQIPWTNVSELVVLAHGGKALAASSAQTTATTK